MGRPSLTGSNGWSTLLKGVAGPLLLIAAVRSLGADVPPTSQAPPAQAAVQPVPVDLSTCLRIALDKQPTLAALRASLAAAHAQQQGLEDLHAPPIFAGRELPIRRQQACLGVLIAEAGLNQAQWETLYAVQRTYFSAVYAREQLSLANEVHESLKTLVESTSELLKGGTRRDLTQGTVDQMTTLLRLARVRRLEAELGIKRSQAALREAMGVDCDFPLQVVDSTLPLPTVQLCREQIVALALSRRGEMVQVLNAAETTALEIDAQSVSHAAVTRTFAAGSDVHARQIPAGLSNGEYRPGAVGLEMPTMFAGTRSARIERAQAFNARAHAVIDKTRNLIILEAEDAYFRWEENTQRIQELRDAATVASKLANDTQKAFLSSQNVRSDEALLNRRLEVEARALLNEARFQQILALAAVERITAGGICTGLWMPGAAQP